jgi:hypothetical protein
MSEEHEEGCACCGNPNFDRDDFLIAVHENVKKHYCHLNGIMAEPPFTYSTGLTTHDLPELIMTGMNMKQCAGIIMTIVHLIKDDGLEIADGQVIKLENYNDLPVAFVKVSEEHKNEMMGVTYQYLGKNKPFEALQVVWTDRNGKFPWDVDFEKRFNQAMLGEVNLV